MDDDVVCEPESIIRAVTFGDLARRPDDRRRPHVQPLHQVAAAQLRRDRQPLAVLVDARRRRLETDWDFARPQPALARAGCTARRRRLQRLVHVPDPDARCVARDRAVSLPLFIKWDDSEYGAARQGGRLPDRHVARRRGLARPVDRQERRARLAGLLPPAQPVRRGAAALAVPARRPDGPRELQPPGQAPARDAVLHRRAAPPRARGRAGRPGRGCTTSCRPSSARSARCASSSPTPSSRPTRDAFPPVRRDEAARSKDRDSEIPGRASQLLSAVRRRSASCARHRGRSRASSPRSALPAMDARWYRLATLDSAVVSDARRHLGRALPARPASCSATCCAGPSRSTSGSTASGRGSRSATATSSAEVTSPQRWEKTFAASTEEPLMATADKRDAGRRSTSAAAARTPPVAPGGWPRSRPTRCRSCEATGPAQEPGRRRRAGLPGAAGRHHRDVPAALPAAPDRLARAGRDVRRLAARPAVVLRPAGDAVRHLLLGDGVHPQAAPRRSATSRSTCSPASSWCTTSARPGTAAPGRSGRTRALVQKMRMPREIFPVASMLVAAYHTLPAAARAHAVLRASSGWHLTWAASPPASLGLAILVTFAMALALFFSRAERVLPRLPEHRADDHCSSCTSWCR